MSLDMDSPRFALPGRAGTIATVIAVAYCLYETAYAIGLLRTEFLHLYPGTFRSIVLAIALILTFMLLPARRGIPRNRIPWYDYLLMAASLPGPIYMAWAYVELIPIHPYFATPSEQVLAVLTAAVVLEATRRTVGWTVPLLAGRSMKVRIRAIAKTIERNVPG
jgi:TRAP-type uncharacterized transport system fused permease subunit